MASWAAKVKEEAHAQRLEEPRRLPKGQQAALLPSHRRHRLHMCAAYAHHEGESHLFPMQDAEVHLQQTTFQTHLGSQNIESYSLHAILFGQDFPVCERLPRLCFLFSVVVR